MSFKLNKLAALVAVTLSATAAPSAFAAVEGMGQAVRLLSNFAFYKEGATAGTKGAILNAATDFTSFAALDNASVSATLNGTTIGQTGNSLPPSPPADFLQKCLGNCTFGENDYGTRTIPTVGTFSRSDQQLLGVVVAGIPIGGNPSNGFEPTPAQSKLVAETQIRGSGSGNAQTTSGTGGTFTFTAASAGKVFIEFNANDYLYAYVNPAVDAFASTSLSFTLRNISAGGTTIFSWSPDGQASTLTGGGQEIADPCNLNNSVSANFAIAGFEVTASCSGLFQALTPALVAGNIYQLSFAETVTSAATVVAPVPEPGTLAIVGAALAGLGLTRRRQAKKVS